MRVNEEILQLRFQIYFNLKNLESAEFFSRVLFTLIVSCFSVNRFIHCVKKIRSRKPVPVLSDPVIRIRIQSFFCMRIRIQHITIILKLNTWVWYCWCSKKKDYYFSSLKTLLHQQSDLFLWSFNVWFTLKKQKW